MTSLKSYSRYIDYISAFYKYRGIYVLMECGVLCLNYRPGNHNKHLAVNLNGVRMHHRNPNNRFITNQPKQPQHNSNNPLPTIFLHQGNQDYGDGINHEREE